VTKWHGGYPTAGDELLQLLLVHLQLLLLAQGVCGFGACGKLMLSVQTCLVAALQGCLCDVYTQ
jgi:hypothetical protein